ncbi:MAG: DUF3990 domain-containing protein [Clostridiales bacterium]|nr:DUF3990 domain-containing protein [Clostridiales bacterium]
MILYHGSNMIVEEIELARCRPYRDFGAGFYLTTYPDQARRMAARVVRLYGGSGAVSTFEFDEAAATGLNTLSFAKPSIEWARFVMNNRNRIFDETGSSECNHDAKYDIVVGPIANDDMVLLFRQYAEEFITIETLARDLEFCELTNQYSFHTEKAIATLKYKGVLDE